MKKFTSDSLIAALKKASADMQSSGSSLLASLEKQGIPNSLILVTEESLRAKRLLDWIQKCFSGLETQALYGAELRSKSSAKELIASISNPSLFAPSQMLIVHGADKMRVLAAEPLAEKIAEGGLSTFVIFLSEKQNTKSALYSRLGGISATVSFPVLSPEKLRKWVAREASSKGIEKIESRAASRLIQAYSGDLSAISMELSKLALLCETGETLTAELVESQVSVSPEVGSFDLLSAIADKNLVRSELLVRSLLGGGMHPLQLSAFLSRCLRTLVAVHAGGSEFSSKELSNGWFLKNVKRHSRAFSLRDLRIAIRHLSHLDFQLKGGGVSDHLSLLLVLRKLCLRMP